MRATPRALTLGAVISLLAITACGGGDDATSADDRPSGSEPATSEDAQANDDDTGTAEATEGPGTTDTSDTSDTDTDGSSSGDLSCGDIFDSAEINEWFGEPSEITEETTDSLGQLVCTWETIEDPENLDDLAVSIIVAQVFSGDPVPAENFIDPDIFEEVTMLEGLGDVAFSTGELGQGFYFYDEPVAGTLTISDIDMGDGDAPAPHTSDEQEALFRTFHARVTE